MELKKQKGDGYEKIFAFAAKAYEAYDVKFNS